MFSLYKTSKIMYFMSHFDDKPWLKVIDKTGCSEVLELEDVTKLPIMS